MAAGRFQEAIPVYQDLVRALPNNPGLLMNLGLAQHMAGQDRQAVQQFEAVLKLDPNHLPAFLFLGAARLELGEPARALPPLQKVVTAQPANKEARQMLADALLATQRFEQAAEQLRRLAQLDPDNPKSWHGLGRCYEALSGRAFRQLEKIAPESPHWLALVAASRLHQRQYSSAYFFYREALTKPPILRGLHTAVAEIYRHTGHADWAAIEEEKEKKLPPPDCRREKLECDFRAARYQQVVAAASLQKTAPSYYWQSQACNELARQAFARLEQLPLSLELHQLLAETHRSQGRHLESAREWKAALALSPGRRALEKELAASLFLSRDYPAAQPLLEKLLAREPNSPELNHMLGDTLLSQQQPEKALTYLQRAVQSEPARLNAQASLARAYLQTGAAERAIPHLMTALSSDEDGSLHFQLARAYQATGRENLAKDALEKYQQLTKTARAQRRALEQQVQITPP